MDDTMTCQEQQYYKPLEKKKISPRVLLEHLISDGRYGTVVTSRTFFLHAYRTIRALNVVMVAARSADEAEGRNQSLTFSPEGCGSRH